MPAMALRPVLLAVSFGFPPLNMCSLQEVGNISTIYTEYDDYQTDYNAEPPTPPTTTITAYPSGSTDLSLLSPATIPLR